MSRTMREQLQAVSARPKRTEPVTPWNPSRTATARVPDPVPMPSCCPNCDHPDRPVYATNDEVYRGRLFGEWPWIVLCRGCGSYVGLHPFTGIPLGTLADEATRNYRKATKNAFNPLWMEGALTRTKAYAWLADALGIPVSECHIGMFDIDRCKAAMLAISKRNRPTLTLQPRPMTLAEADREADSYNYEIDGMGS